MILQSQSFFQSLYSEPINVVLILLAVVNTVIMLLALRSTQRLKTALFQGASVLERFLKEQTGVQEAVAQTIRSDFAVWETLYRDATRWYYLFSSLIAVFPLLGISGTVIGIIPALSDFEHINQYFSLALSSTLMGILFSVIFKVVEGMISGDYALVSERISIITSDITKLVLEKEENNQSE